MRRSTRISRPTLSGSSRSAVLLGNDGDGSTLTLDFTTGQLDPRLTFTRASNATFINSSGLVEWANSNMYWNTAFEGLSGTNPSLTSSGWGYVFSSGNAVFNGDGTVTMTTTAAQRSVLFRSTGFSGGGLRVVSSVDVTIHSGSLQASQVIVTGTPVNAQHYVNGLIWNNTHPNWNGGILPVGTQFNIAYATDTQTAGTTSMWFGVGATSAIAGSATFVNPRWTMWKGSATVPYYPNTSATNNVPSNNYKSADYQAPRFDYDPTTQAPRGLLIEGTATNLFNWSESFDTTGGATNWNWSAINVTRGTVTTTNPTGASATVIKIEETTANGIHAPLTTPTALASTTYTFSVWAKAVERTFVQLLENAGSGAISMVNLSTGAIVSESTAGITLVTPLGSTGWYRISMRFTTIVGQTTANCQLRLSTNGTTTSYAGTTGSGIYIWGAQLEQGSGASSYVPTGASTVQRLADECSMTGTNFSSWFNATEGTFLANAQRMRTTDIGRIASANDNTANESIDIGASTTGQFIVTDGGSALATITPGTVTANTAFKIAGAFKLNDVQAALGGTLGTPDTSVTMPTVTQLMIGRQAGGSPVYLNGTVSLLKFWPTRLPNAQLQAITT